MFMKKVFIIILVTCCVTLLHIPVRAFGMVYSCSIGFVIQFMLYIFLAKKIAGKMSLEGILFSMLLGYLALDLPVRLPDFSNSLISLPDVLMHLGGEICAYIACRFSAKRKYIPFLIGLCICLFMSVSGYFTYIHYLNFGSFSGKIHVKCPLPLELKKINQEIVRFDSSDEYVVLYFWNEHCGQCIKSFPKLQELYEHSPENVCVYSCYLGKETDFSKQAISYTSGYTFPVLFPLNCNDSIYMQIEVAPTVLIFDLSSGSIIFKGNLKKAEKLIDRL